MFSSIQAMNTAGLCHSGQTVMPRPRLEPADDPAGHPDHEEEEEEEDHRGGVLHDVLLSGAFAV